METTKTNALNETKITPKLFEITEQLGEINAYFYGYRKIDSERNDNIRAELKDIEDALSDVVNSISQLMYIELLDNFYYKELEKS
jgi:hypothetical protein